MNHLANGWFTELSPAVTDGKTKVSWKGQAFSLEVKQVLFESRSKFQDILIFESVSYGRVLALDGIIQCTERDEFAYQEMMANSALHMHPNPKRVLIIGGGDGGVAREVLKHVGIELIVVVEIDEAVINACRGFLPSMAKGFDDSRVKLIIQDGVEFLKKTQEKFDVIISDTTDPIGPGKSLFTSSYFSMVRNTLSSIGAFIMQAESMWLHLDLIKELYLTCKNVFPVVSYGYTMVPTYPSGIIGNLLCSVNEKLEIAYPLRMCDADRANKLGLRYYNSDVHYAAYQLPQFAKVFLEGKPTP